MRIIDNLTWELLVRDNPKGEVLIARPAFTENVKNVLCAVDTNGFRHLLIQLNPNEDELSDSRSRGLLVSTRSLSIQGNRNNKYIDVECKDKSGFPILDLMGGEIFEKILASNTQPADIVKQVLSKWRRFWSQPSQKILSREEQIGLFAEVWLLYKWLVPKFGINVIYAWRGPWGGRHDFEWLDNSIEVKATTNSRGKIFHINSIDQLDLPENGPLYLYSLLLREELGASNILSKIINECREQFLLDENALIQFESGLSEVGYSPIHADEYSKLHFYIMEESLFSVRDDFPRLIPKSFSPSIPIGIEKIEYEINLNSFEHLVVSTENDVIPLTPRLIEHV